MIIYKTCYYRGILIFIKNFKERVVLMEQKDLLSLIRNLAISKQLNILMGSGVSMPAIHLMSHFEGKNTEEKNNKLLEEIKYVSGKLIDVSCELSEYSYLTLDNYKKFVNQILNLLTISNSRQTPRSVNIFTTNYDLFIEKAIDELLTEYRFIFNDGASGYFNRYLDSANYNKTVSYKGLNDNYINELPTINLIKPHGSVNWKNVNGDKILVTSHVVDDCVVIKPTGKEEQDTFLNNHFHEMLRLFQLELDKPQSVLFVIGFSFQDKHIAKMFKRALQNPELLAIIFCFNEKDKENIKNNLLIVECNNNLIMLTPNDFNHNENDKKILNQDNNGKLFFNIASLTKILEGNGYEW